MIKNHSSIKPLSYYKGTDFSFYCFVIIDNLSSKINILYACINLN
nr:MAG TPA: hypothetical protein [Caudoviricetes sp.]